MRVLIAVLFFFINSYLSATESKTNLEIAILENFTSLNPNYKDYVPVSEESYITLCGKKYCSIKGIKYSSPIVEPFFITNPITLSKDYIAVFGKLAVFSSVKGIFDDLTLVYFIKNKSGIYESVLELKGVLKETLGTQIVSGPTYSKIQKYVNLITIEQEGEQIFTAYYNDKLKNVVVSDISYKSKNGNVLENIGFSLNEPISIISHGYGSSSNGYGENYISTFDIKFCDPISLKNILPNGPLLKYVSTKKGIYSSRLDHDLISAAMYKSDRKKELSKKRCL